MKFKDGVDLNGIDSVMIHALCSIDNVYRYYGEELVVTSCMDGRHKKGSLHYKGKAVDTRTRYFGELELQRIKYELIDVLGSNFDVVLESDHFHIEYDPK